VPVRENIAKVLKDLILPELHTLRSEVSKLGTRLDAVDNRLADFSGRFHAIDARCLAIDQHLGGAQLAWRLLLPRLQPPGR
jgi:hypothetical protein